MSKYYVSAPAKVILFGEHAVVYDQPCVAASLDKLTFGLGSDIQHGLELFCPDIQLDYHSNGTTNPNGLEPHQQAALDAFLEIAHSLEIDQFRIEIRSEIPVGAGLGSSASFSVCLATLLLLKARKISPHLTDEMKQSINKYAFQAEKVIHGNPSGVDNTLCTFGGAKLYQKSCDMVNLDGFPPIQFLLVD